MAAPSTTQVWPTPADSERNGPDWLSARPLSFFPQHMRSAEVVSPQLCSAPAETVENRTPAGAAVRPLASRPQQTTPLAFTAQAWSHPASTNRNSPAGACAWPWLFRPQHVIDPVTCSPHEKRHPEVTWVYLMAFGASSCPESFDPQQNTRPSCCSPQAWFSPMATWAKARGREGSVAVGEPGGVSVVVGVGVRASGSLSPVCAVRRRETAVEGLASVGVGVAARVGGESCACEGVATCVATDDAATWAVGLVAAPATGVGERVGLATGVGAEVARAAVAGLGIGVGAGVTSA